MYFKIQPQYLDLMKRKMEAAGIRNMSAYIRKMCCDGYIVRLDLTDVRRMVQLLSNVTNNLNQIAKHLNAGILNPLQGKDTLSVLARSLVDTHFSVRLALSEGKTEE